MAPRLDKVNRRLFVKFADAVRTDLKNPKDRLLTRSVYIKFINYFMGTGKRTLEKAFSVVEEDIDVTLKDLRDFCTFWHKVLRIKQEFEALKSKCYYDEGEKLAVARLLSFESMMLSQKEKLINVIKSFYSEVKTFIRSKQRNDDLAERYLQYFVRFSQQYQDKWFKDIFDSDLQPENISKESVLKVIEGLKGMQKQSQPLSSEEKLEQSVSRQAQAAPVSKDISRINSEIKKINHSPIVLFHGKTIRLEELDVKAEEKVISNKENMLTTLFELQEQSQWLKNQRDGLNPSIPQENSLITAIDALVNKLESNTGAIISMIAKKSSGLSGTVSHFPALFGNQPKAQNKPAPVSKVKGEPEASVEGRTKEPFVSVPVVEQKSVENGNAGRTNDAFVGALGEQPKPREEGEEDEEQPGMPAFPLPNQNQHLSSLISTVLK